VVWNEADVHVLIAEGLGGGIAQVLKKGGLRWKGWNDWSQWRVAGGEWRARDRRRERKAVHSRQLAVHGWKKALRDNPGIADVQWSVRETKLSAHRHGYLR